MTAITHSPWFALVVVIGTAARLTRLVVHDRIGAPLRAWAIRVSRDPDGTLAAFMRCPWCVGTWASALTVAGYVLAHHFHRDGAHWWFDIPALVLTVAQAAGMLNAPPQRPAAPASDGK